VLAIVTTPIDATRRWREPDWGKASAVAFEGLSQLALLRTQVMNDNACALPGVSIKYETFVPAMWTAVERGYVARDAAQFVADGLRYGFMVGVDTKKLQGHRWFKNYPGAIEARSAVTRATSKRVEAGKTVHLGSWTSALADAIRNQFSASCIFPMNAVPKPLEPGEMRPCSDHTRTGLNAATDLTFLKHSLDTYKEIAWFLKQDYFMRVSDVEAAFLLLPLHPDLWPFFMFRFFAADHTNHLSLFAHLCGDFGAAGMPGVFKVFFVDVVVNMARAAQVLTLPLPVYVDDCSCIGPEAGDVDNEMEAFHAWAWTVCGVAFKVIKDRMASQHQLVLGFWWDSRTFTRTLEEKKLECYLQMLEEFSTRSKLTLHEMQVAAGRMHRAILTLPPGAACLLAGLFTLMAGLVLPWHLRRTTRGVRQDFKELHKLLSINLGKGFYSLEHFARAPVTLSDSSKSKPYTGGGFISGCGRYHFFRYGNKASRHLIDELEGDTVVYACECMSPQWRHKVVPFGIDNSAFQLSVAKSRSRVPRLNVLVRRLFAIQVEGQFILETFWLSTADNFLADHLSRDREWDCLRAAFQSMFWVDRLIPLRHERAGEVRTFGSDQRVTHNFLPHAQFEYGGDTGTRLRGGAPRMTFNSTVPYARASLFEGLPPGFEHRIEQVLDNRLSSSSWRTVSASLSRWRPVAEQFEWPVVISADDPRRGGKLATFVMLMVDETELTYKSIENYVWGLRTWQKLQHQPDPAFGILGWDDFMDAVKVLTWVPAEPRKAVPREVIEKIVADTDTTEFKEVLLTTLMLILFMTFSRSECPCPKTQTGRDGFDPEWHWTIDDFDIVWIDGVQVLKVRFKKVKQDQRVERPEAAGNNDWAYLAAVPESELCPVKWVVRYTAFFVGSNQSPKDPFFTGLQRRGALTYSAALTEFKERQRRVGVKEGEEYGLHGLRVEGYNLSKHGLGADLTAAHGLWFSSAHTRYERFKLAQVFRITGVLAGTDAGDSSDGAERPNTRTDQRLTRGQAAAAAEVETEAVLLPPGWEAERRGETLIYRSREGRLASSRADAWNMARELDPTLHGDELNDSAAMRPVRAPQRGPPNPNEFL
jgi:hypothetical protein